MKKFLKRTLIVLILLFTLPVVSYFGIVSKYGSVAASGAQSGVSNDYAAFKEKNDGTVRIMSFNFLQITAASAEARFHRAQNVF